MPRLWQRGRAALRAGAASQLEGSLRARSLPAGMARDAVAGKEREGGKLGSALYCWDNWGAPFPLHLFREKFPEVLHRVISYWQMREKIILPVSRLWLPSACSLDIKLTNLNAQAGHTANKTLPFTWIPAEGEGGKISLGKYPPWSTGKCVTAATSRPVLCLTYSSTCIGCKLKPWSLGERKKCFMFPQAWCPYSSYFTVPAWHSSAHFVETGPQWLHRNFRLEFAECYN